jgi:hypothetical protein
MNSLKSYLSDAQCDAPFSKEIQSIRLKGNTYSSSLPTGLSCAMPRCLLKYVPNVTKLETHRSRYEGWLPGSNLTTITTQDLVQLRNLCPRLEESWLDVIYGPKSPADIDDLIANLAQIERLSKLVIYIHNGSSRFRKTIMTRWDCRLIFNTIVRQRMAKQLPCGAPFAVKLKLVREWDKMKAHSCTSDYEFWINQAGLTNFRRRPQVASWDDLKGNFRRDYYRARDSVRRAFRGEVAK